MLFDKQKKIPISALRTRMGLFAPVEVQDETGGVARSFAQIATLWCNMEPFSGDERFYGGKVEEDVSHRITIRWRGDITGAMRLYLGSRQFNILASSDPDNRRRRLMILVQELKS